MMTDPHQYRVLFVCTANICRSAYADVISRNSSRVVEFSSAGIRALVDEPIDPPMAALAEQRGDPAPHRARQLTHALAQDADLILTMARDHRRYILDEWPALGRKAFVIGHAARVMADLPEDVTLQGLVEHLWRNRTQEPGDEVPDPYRRGSAAARRAANQIDQYMEIIGAALQHLAQR